MTITRELLDELCLKYPQHKAAKIVGKTSERQRECGEIPAAVAFN